MSGRYQPGGLPSGPRSRSQSRRGQEDVTTLSYGRSSRPDRPLASERPEIKSIARTSPFPRARAPTRHHSGSDSGSSTSSQSYRSSEDSIASSRFMDRIRAGTGYSSSRTSVDDDTYTHEKIEVASTPSYGFGDGSAIWSTVATAASSLTVNVSKAWASNITVFAGEETPPGSESRLTRAMKAYHREKAKSPADLPDFLFDEHERRIPVQAAGYPSSGEYEADARRTASRGLRDVYQAAANPASPDHRSESVRRPLGDGNSAPRSTDRLRAMRDAKKAVGQQPTASANNHRRQDRFDSPPAGPGHTHSLGLPANPGRRRY